MATFQETGLDEQILKAIGELGFVEPTPVQEKSIPEILNCGKDIVSLAQTGTGKTGAFGLPIVQMADPSLDHVQAMILSPTRELCLQISKDLTNFAKYKPEVQICAVYGGSDIRKQIRQLRQGAQIVVGTPGRVIDLIERDVLKIDQIRWLVLDEADEMLDMGFKDDLETILSSTPETRQTLLFSATMPPFIAKVASNYMNDPIEIKIGRTNQGADTVEHHYYLVRPGDRYLALKRIVDMVPDIYSIVFCRTREETKEVAEKLIADGYNADALHGDLSQAQRDMVMQRFKMKHLQILVATDVAARGIDVRELTHVINYNLPDDIEVYIHRSGRTGRAGRTGISAAIVCKKEQSKIKQIEKISGKTFIRKMVPNADEICQLKLQYFVQGIADQQVDEESAVAKFIPEAIEKLAQFSKEEVIAKFISAEFESVNKYYQSANDLNVAVEEPRKKGERQLGDENMSRLFINVGKIDAVRPGDIIALINEFTRDLPKVNIGHIDIMRNFSFVDVDGQYSDQIVAALNGRVVDGYRIICEVAVPRSDSDDSEGGDSRRSRGGFGGGFGGRRGGRRSDRRDGRDFRDDYYPSPRPNRADRRHRDRGGKQK
ncbi:MAG: DEAD/DEAH box helicase [Bacteroidales bacterium]|nr:DEAD/DEAH box helicase [Bacteroidales bacterium]